MVDEISIQTAILECVDSTLKELGQNVGQVVFFHIEKSFGIGKKKILNQPEVFSQALHSIFGQGANVIERLIAQKIPKKQIAP